MIKKVRAASLLHFPEICLELGINPKPLLNQFGLDMTMLSKPELRIPAISVANLLEHTAVLTNCPVIGIKMAGRRKLSSFGVLGLLLAHQHSLANGIDAICKYKKMLSEILHVSIERTNSNVIVKIDLVFDEPVVKSQVIEFVIATAQRYSLYIHGTHCSDSKVYFRHKAPLDCSMHKSMFGCPVIFESNFNGISFPCSWFDAQSPHADSTLVTHAETLIAQHVMTSESQFDEDIRHVLVMLLPERRATIAQVAKYMGMTHRTFQRQLAENNLSFASILQDLRCNLVKEYLIRQDYSVERISELVGYANGSSFCRWFFAQFGCSPKQYRQQRLKELQSASDKS